MVFLTDFNTSMISSSCAYFMRSIAPKIPVKFPLHLDIFFTYIPGTEKCTIARQQNNHFDEFHHSIIEN
ncbi:MAG: hypothetical protein C0191_00150 [Mucilaginibacter sp.]|nr:MAG: hypothetical protein C0191_00150 [Mucilaginibacter sp.]